MSDIPQSLKISEKLPSSKRQKIIGLTNVLILIGLLVYLLDSAWFAVVNDSNVVGNLFSALALLVRALPICLLFFVVWSNKICLTRISTIFWSFTTLIVSAVSSLLIGIVILNTTFNTNFFGFPKF